MHYTLEGLEAFSGTINDLFRAVAPINLFELGADWEIYLAALRVNEAARSSVLEGWYAVCGMPEPDRERRENEAVQS